jgi:hypothetical protein
LLEVALMAAPESPGAPLAPVPATLLAQLATVPDPRIDRTKAHQLVDILAIALLAVPRELLARRAARYG